MTDHKIINFIQDLNLTEDYSTRKFSLLPFQKHILNSIFGTLREDGTRQYRTCLLMLPRKQGKTELCAAIATYCLFLEPNGGQIILVAASIKQASEMYRKTAQMIRSHPYLNKLIKKSGKLLPGTKTMRFKDTTLTVLSSDVGQAYGYNPSVLLYDELLAANTKDLYYALTSCQQTRLNPLTIAISTASEYDSNSLLHELYTYAKKVQTEDCDKSFLPIIYEGKGDWQDRKTWYEAMPALQEDHSDKVNFCSLKFIEDEYQKACILPSREVVFKTLYLNQFVSNLSAFIPFQQWQACKVATLPECKIATAGVDLSQRTDLSSAVLWFANGNVLPFFWLPEYAIKRRAAADKKSLALWCQQGFITVCPGDVIDQDMILAKLIELRKQYQIRWVAIDPHNACNLDVSLQKNAFRVEPFAQTVGRFNSPTKELQALVLQKKLHHLGHPVLDWQMENLKVKTTQDGDIKPIKESETSDSNDGAIAMIMALGIHMQKPASIYESGASLRL